MAVTTIQRKRGGLPINNHLLHNGATNSREMTGLNICTTYGSFFQSKEKVMPQNSIYILSSIGHKTWKDKGYQVILIGDINKYILNKKYVPYPPN